MTDNIKLPGIEVFRTNQFRLYSDEFRGHARTVALLRFIPVMQIEGADTVLYAVSSGAIRQAKQKLE